MMYSTNFTLDYNENWFTHILSFALSCNLYAKDSGYLISSTIISVTPLVDQYHLCHTFG